MNIISLASLDANHKRGEKEDQKQAIVSCQGGKGSISEYFGNIQILWVYSDGNQSLLERENPFGFGL